MNNASTNYCHYCKKEVVGKEHYFKHKMWFVTKRTIFPAGIEFKEQEVPVSRCQICYGKHHKSYMMILWAVLVIGFFLLFRFKVGTWPIETGQIIFAYFLSTIGAFGIVGVIIVVWEFLFFKMINKISRESDVADYPIVKALEDLGWLSSKPNPKTAELSRPKEKWD